MKNKDLIKLFNEAFSKSGDRYGSEEIIKINWKSFKPAEYDTYGAGGCRVYVEVKQSAPHTFRGEIWLKYENGNILYGWETSRPKYILPNDGSKFYNWIYNNVIEKQGIKEIITIKGLSKCFADKKVDFIYIKKNDLWYIQCRNIFKQILYDILQEVYPEYKWGYDYIPDRSVPFSNEICITTPFELCFMVTNHWNTYDLEIHVK